jgi:histidyl-tRNA synthetase
MLIDLSNINGSVDEVASKAGIAGLESWKRLVGLMDSLANRNVRNARINLGIVRGLDYYSGMVFEAFDRSAKEGALVGGGRYDSLTEAFGRKDIGATGAAGGIERIVMALRKHGVTTSTSQRLVYVAYANDELRNSALKLASILRSNGIVTEYDLLGKPLRKQLDDASGKKAKVAVIVAPQEYSAGSVVVRTLDDGKETNCSLEKINEVLREMLRA